MDQCWHSNLSIAGAQVFDFVFVNEPMAGRFRENGPQLLCRDRVSLAAWNAAPPYVQCEPKPPLPVSHQPRICWEMRMELHLPVFLSPCIPSRACLALLSWASASDKCPLSQTPVAFAVACAPSRKHSSQQMLANAGSVREILVKSRFQYGFFIYMYMRCSYSVWGLSKEVARVGKLQVYLKLTVNFL